MALNPAWLNTFVTLVQTGHFTETAKRLYMTQPGVTQHIHKLEDALSCQLLHRTGKQFEMTAEGEKLYHYALEQQSHYQYFVDGLHDNDPYKGECQIACSGAVAMSIYPALIELQCAHPSLSISVESAPNRRIFSLLESNQIAFGITTQKPVDDSLTAIPIGKQLLALFVPASANQAATLEDLQSLGYIDHPDAKHYLDRILMRNFQSRYKGLDKVPKRGYINQLNQILMPVAAGVGFTALPHRSGSLFSRPNDIAVMPMETPISDDLYLVYKTHRHAITRYLWLEPLLIEILKTDV